MSGQFVSDYDFVLPPELIAQQPPAVRGASRMVLLDRTTGEFEDSEFSSLSTFLNPGDLLVFNDSRVIPARLYAHRTVVRDREQPSGQIEVLLTEPAIQQKPRAPSLRLPSGARVGNDELKPPLSANCWRALVRPGKKVAVGEHLVFPAHSGEILLEAQVIERGEFGERLLQFAPTANFFDILDRIGHMPLPPYIRRDDAVEDRERYQTVFSQEKGSVAAPTAGLHFTPATLNSLTAKGIEIARLTLHVGLGTFSPLRVDRLEDVRLHRERYTLTADAAVAINAAARSDRRIVAIGTTVVRTLEHCALQAMGRELAPHSGETEIFISPGFQFKLVGALLTNFHLPQSSLLMLVSAFAGREHVLAAYRHAVEQKYRFFSYGDCMFIR